jgi:[protein-PII] uridylyltransferase
MGLQIQTASVSTYGDRVVDVFYVKDGFGLKITSETRLQAIQQALLEVLKTSDPANQVAA